MESLASLFTRNFMNLGRPVSFVRFKSVLRRKPRRVLTSMEANAVVKKAEKDHDLIKSKALPAAVMKGGIPLPVTPYVKLKESDERYAKVFSVIKSERPGENENKILLEGIRLINDAIKAGARLESLFFSREETLSKVRFMKPEKVNLYKVMYKTLQLWSSLEKCPGIMGIFKKPLQSDLKITSEPVIPVTVLGYNIRDHRVMGSIIRNAACAGCKNVLFTKGCMNVWAQKVLRAASGAHFHIPVIDNIEWPLILNYVPNDASIYFVDSRTEAAVDVYDELLESVQARNSDSDSEHSEDDDSEFSEDDIENLGREAYVTRNEEGGQTIVNTGYTDQDHLSNFEPELLSTVRYSDISFRSKNIFVCISDRNFCEDARAMKLGCDFGGLWLNIPTENTVCKVSSSLALPIILYEIKRQIGEEYILE